MSIGVIFMAGTVVKSPGVAAMGPAPASGAMIERAGAAAKSLDRPGPEALPLVALVDHESPQAQVRIGLPVAGGVLGVRGPVLQHRESDGRAPRQQEAVPRLGVEVRLREGDGIGGDEAFLVGTDLEAERLAVVGGGDLGQLEGRVAGRNRDRHPLDSAIAAIQARGDGFGKWGQVQF